MFGHDIFFLLDNGWRVINGQRVHLDYYSPWGPVTFLITAAGPKMSHNSVNGIGYVTVFPDDGLRRGLTSFARITDVNNGSIVRIQALPARQAVQ